MSVPEAGNPVSSRRMLRVLYVEDSQQDAKLCLRELERVGYQLSADVVRTREDFLDGLRSKPYDIVLSDYRMPNWSGMEALEILKQVSPDIPLIIVTGAVGDEAAVECVKRGAIDCVLKDRLARLPFAVERALREKDARADHRRAEENLKLLASIVEFSEDAILSASLDGIILSWNRGAERMYGYLAEDAVGKPVSILVPAERMDEMRLVLERVWRGEHVSHFETERLTKSGQHLEVSLTISPMRDLAGQVRGASSIARRLGDRRRSAPEPT